MTLIMNIFEQIVLAMGKSLDATQEMFALGLCNMFASFVRSMPITGSFTRTAVNHSSGVKTTLGGLFTGKYTYDIIESSIFFKISIAICIITISSI